MSLILIECPVCQTDRTVEYFQDEQTESTILLYCIIQLYTALTST